MSLAGKTNPRRLHRLTSFSIVTGRLDEVVGASTDKKAFLRAIDLTGVLGFRRLT
jgi:hypothetical protein